MNVLEVTVPGVALPQGSKRPVRNKYSGKLSVIDNNPRLKEWRFAVTAYAKEAMATCGFDPCWPMTEPIHLDVIFSLPRPKSHYGTGGRAEFVKASAPRFPTTYPDLDKLQRAILDGFTDAGVWADDSQVVRIRAEKQYAPWGETPHAWVRVRPL